MSQWAFPHSRLLVFARSPVAGQVKTRLQPVLGEQGCLDLYRRLLDRAMTTVSSSKLAPVQLWVDQDPHHQCFLSYCNKRDIFLQEKADLGRRMAVAAAHALAQPGVESVILLGADCPVMSTGHLRQALQRLASGSDVVITPAEDGGYVLLGLRSPQPSLFKDIAWGEANVFASTMERCASSELEVSLMPELWDVDRIADLERLASLDNEFARFVNRG